MQRLPSRFCSSFVPPSDTPHCVLVGYSKRTPTSDWSGPAVTSHGALAVRRLAVPLSSWRRGDDLPIAEQRQPCRSGEPCGRLVIDLASVLGFVSLNVGAPDGAG